MPRFYRD